MHSQWFFYQAAASISLLFLDILRRQICLFLWLKAYPEYYDIVFSILLRRFGVVVIALAFRAGGPSLIPSVVLRFTWRVKARLNPHHARAIRYHNSDTRMWVIRQKLWCVVILIAFYARDENCALPRSSSVITWHRGICVSRSQT